MKSEYCSRKTREHIDTDVRRELAQHSNFGCSVCGAIPIVFHHIEEWAKSFSNDKKYLIPLCDRCHKGIHGEGGSLLAKDELYDYKANPTILPLLSDKLPLERKKTYSFFIGSNFMAEGVKASLFTFSQGHNLLTVDTSTNGLMLSVLSEIKDGKPIYLLRNNELLICTKDIWDMHYSRNSLKIWRIADGLKTVFIDFTIKADEKLIILREMNTTFDGKQFRIYRYRKPQERQVEKIRKMVKQCEEYFYQLALQIDGKPRIHNEIINGIDFDVFVRETKKNLIKSQIQQALAYDFYHEFNWDFRYYHWVLGRVLAESPVFARSTDAHPDLSEGFKPAYEMIANLKTKYREEFQELEGTVVEYGGSWLENIQVHG